MSSVDFTPVILAQLTDLQMRVTKQDAMITALKAEVERLSGKGPLIAPMPPNPDMRNIMNTSIPLLPPVHPVRRDTRETYDKQANQNKYDKKDKREKNDAPRSRPKVARQDGDKPATIPMTLSDVVHKDEIVTIQVGTGKGSDGKFTYTTANAVFDGTDLCVESCELAPSLVGLKSSKPGEILYKFIDALKEAGHIQRTFTIAPWKLCFVERNGVRKSLEDLRNVVG